VYVVLVAALFGGIAYLINQDLEAGKRKREAVQSRAEMADKLRSQGMLREAAILDMEREQLEEQIESARAKPVWEEISNAAKSRSDRMTESAQAMSSTNREDRRVAERQQARQKRKDAKAQRTPATVSAKPPPPAA
jgi:ribosome-binding ATPase YchF (GTP1/OBG family)